MATKELIGKIIIQEKIDTIDENKLPNTFVINVPDPYKNYYGRFTEIVKPVSIIFVTKTPNSFEKILRVTKKINEKYNLKLDGAKCEVTMNSRKLDGVRVKGINRFHEIGQIQQYYKDECYDFAKSEKFASTEVLIRINRFFNIDELDKGIYHSKDEDNTYYIEVPRYMGWDEFKKLTQEVKHNITDANYDIAKGIFYVHHGITEILRIVKPKATLELLKTIQQKYIEKLY
jgi:ribosome-interacting GTPase 1